MLRSGSRRTDMAQATLLPVTDRPVPALSSATAPRRASVLTTVDQIVASTSNFAVSVLIARAIGPAGYGRYAIAMAVMLLLLGVQQAGIIEPMVISAARRTRGELSAYLSRSTPVAIAAGMAFGTVVAVVGAVGLMAAPTNWGRLTVALGVGVAPVLTQSFLRWRFLAAMQPGRALVNDIIFAVAEIALVWEIGSMHRLTPALALIAIGAGALIATVATTAQTRDWIRSSQPAHRRVLTGEMQVGRWFLADFGVMWVTTQGAVLVVATVLGSRQAGIFRAINDLFGPSRLLMLSLGSIMLPLGARRFHEEGPAALRRFVFRALLVVGLAAGFYSALVGITSRWLLPHLYGQSFSPDPRLVWLIAIQVFLMGLQYPPLFGLKASGQAPSLFRTRGIVAAISVTATVILVPPFGIWGAAWAGVVTGMASATLPAIRYFRRADR